MAPMAEDVGEARAYRHPGTGDTWVFHPDSEGNVSLDARVLGLVLQAAGYRRMPQPDTPAD
jgi:hypothetical protein